jgi:hypothetical protein
LHGVVVIVHVRRQTANVEGVQAEICCEDQGHADVARNALAEWMPSQRSLRISDTVRTKERTAEPSTAAHFPMCCQEMAAYSDKFCEELHDAFAVKWSVSTVGGKKRRKRDVTIYGFEHLMGRAMEHCARCFPPKVTYCIPR